MSSEAPNHVYYRACEGQWRCDFELEISDPAAFRACPMGWLDRQRVTSMVRWARWTGPFVFTTTVDYATRGARGEVVHTARMAKFGVMLMHSTEVLTLDPNGRDFAMRGEQHFWPTGRWRSRSFAGHGRVDETATRATYDFDWFGSTMHQTTIRHELGVDILQESPWSRGLQRLRRAAGSPA